ncbi:sugar phosphate nucleotidyltransferase [Neobacillus vireti]|uniref:sugar phosphate nucleotidyltransferase n=1 Tax=Neobacillus vireti TaxID=220686 RepID=UPI002FFDE4CC
MKLILLSGGSGNRLWPLSNSSRSKQFLKVLRNKDKQVESMVQRIWSQIKSSGLADDTFISTSSTQVDILQSQIGSNIPLIVEPVRRDTFPAIALAAVYLNSKMKVPLNEMICVLPVDSFVEDSFFLRIKEMETSLSQSGADLALIGTPPSYPSEKYGYIIPNENKEGETNNLFRTVKRFVEKPDEELAKQLIQENALWNCGVFAFTLGYMTSILKEKGMPIQYEELVKQYDKLPMISFDYEVVENVNRAVVLSYNSSWKDLGTWNTLTEEMDLHLLGRGIISNSINTHIINELDIPVIALGLLDIVVACSPDGILISEKAMSSKLKDVMKNIKQRPMYEERRWGSYKVLDYTVNENKEEVLTKKIKVLSGKNLSYQFHQQRKEIWSITAGEGIFVLDGNFVHVGPGDNLMIPFASKHAIKAITDLEFIEVQLGSNLIEEDIVRIFMTWEEIEQNLSN